MSTETSSFAKEYNSRAVWLSSIGFLLVHFLASYVLWLVYASARFATFLWTAVLILLAGESLIIGAQRRFSRRYFKAAWLTRLLVIILQTVSGENCLYIWVRDQRLHHKYTNSDADSHKLHHGFLFPYFSWLVVRKHPDVVGKEKTIDMSDPEADSLVMFQKRYHNPLYVALALILPIGVPILWNESIFNSVMVTLFLRFVALLNLSWLVNNAAHVYVTRPDNKDLVTTQNAAVSYIYSGKGWHYYHQAFPWVYRATKFVQNFNISTNIVMIFSKFSTVYDLIKTSLNMVKTIVMKHKDGDNSIWKAMNIEKPEVYTEKNRVRISEPYIEEDGAEKESITKQRSLDEVPIQEQFGRSLNNLRLINLQAQQKSVMEEAVLEKIFTDLGVDEDDVNERNFVSTSLSKGKTPFKNKHNSIHTTRTERARLG